MEWWKEKQKMRYINLYTKLVCKTCRIIISLTKLINKLVSLLISILLCVQIDILWIAWREQRTGRNNKGRDITLILL
jgi:hypothetical protein